MTRKDTTLIESGRKPHEQFGAVNTPVYRASTILFPSVEALRKESQPYTYGRRATPTTRALEEAICKLEGGARTVLTPSGLSACTLAILAACSAGDHLLITDSAYGPTRHFCKGTLARYGIEAEFFEPRVAGGIAKAFRANTKAVFLESPGSLTFEVQDVPAIAAAAHAKKILVILDNTWATPLYFNALEMGTDYSVLALTKYIGGHADVNAGSVTAHAVHAERLVRTHHEIGLTIAGDEAYLGLRGLRTLAVRLSRHQETATALARWLQSRPEVERVLYPALEGDPGHAIWKRDFGGATGLFGVVLKPCSEKAVAAMIDGLKLFGIGYSWGGYESLIIPAHFSREHHTFEAEGPVLRIHVGLEDVEDLKADLAAGFERLAKA
ncbi:MAG: cystathionine beta-lyase [Alphaproteobacteria bacterium]